MRPTTSAAVVAGAYAALATAYIAGSGWVARHLSTDVDSLARLELWKGFAFVAVMTGALFALWYGFSTRLRREAERTQVRERALLNAQRQAELGLFAGSVAHDVNNALFVLRAGVEALRDGEPPSAALVEDMEAALRRATTLTRRLGIGRGSEMAPRASVDLVHLAAEIVDGLRHHPATRNRKVALRVEASVVAPADRDALGDAIGNLIINAGEATAEGGRVEVVVARRGEEAVVEVHDDGPGVPVARVPELFEPFSTTKSAGTGLGLFSVRGCLAAHRGSVAYTRSNLGGACFRLALPAARAGEGTGVSGRAAGR